MRPLSLALLALALWAAPQATARAGDLEERCNDAAARLRSTARELDVSEIPLERARLVAGDALLFAHAAESQGPRPLLLPWLKQFGEDCAKDATLHDLSERLRFAAERVASACAALTAIPPAAAADRARLVAILSRPEYDLHSRDEQFLARLIQRIWTWFRDVFAQSEAVQQSALSIRAAFLILACLAVAYLALRLSRIRLLRRKRLAAPDLGAVALDDPASYQAKARGALDHGDGREAVRLGLLSLLATLERARLASPGRAATNREMAARLLDRGGTASFAASVAEVVDWYDRAWYGLAPVTSEEAARFVGRALELCGEASRSRPREAA